MGSAVSTGSSDRRRAAFRLPQINPSDSHAGLSRGSRHCGDARRASTKTLVLRIAAMSAQSDVAGPESARGPPTACAGPADDFARSGIQTLRMPGRNRGAGG
jgi:hypothetical protein